MQVLGFGLRSGIHAWPPPSRPRWKDTWVARKLEFKGWVAEWSKKHLQAIKDDQVKVVLEELEAMLPKEVHRLGSNQRQPRTVAVENNGQSAGYMAQG